MAGGAGYVSLEPENNLGAVRIASSDSGNLKQMEIVNLDSLNIYAPINFIKIDVEGQEIEVLNSAGRLVQKNRPVLNVEVGWWNEEAFWQWLDIMSYHVIMLFQDTLGVKNYVIVPKFTKNNPC